MFLAPLALRDQLDPRALKGRSVQRDQLARPVLIPRWQGQPGRPGCRAFLVPPGQPVKPARLVRPVPPAYRATLALPAPLGRLQPLPDLPDQRAHKVRKALPVQQGQQVSKAAWGQPVQPEQLARPLLLLVRLGQAALKATPARLVRRALTVSLALLAQPERRATWGQLAPLGQMARLDRPGQQAQRATRGRLDRLVPMGLLVRPAQPEALGPQGRPVLLVQVVLSDQRDQLAQIQRLPGLLAPPDRKAPLALLDRLAPRALLQPWPVLRVRPALAVLLVRLGLPDPPAPLVRQALADLLDPRVQVLRWLGRPDRPGLLALVAVM